MLSSLERIGCLVQGKLPDRVPVVCNLLEQGAKELGMSIKKYYSEHEYVVEGQLKMQEKYGYDNIWAFMYTGVLAEILGSKKMIYSEDGPPNVGHMIIKDYNDIKSLTIPDNLEETAAMQRWLKCIHLLKHEVGHKVPILSAIVSSFTLPAILMGMEKWFELLLFGDVDIRNELLHKCVTFNQKLIKCFRENGVTMISYSNPMGGSGFITYEQFMNQCFPWIQKDIENMGTEGLVYFNGGSPMNYVLEDLITKAGFGAFYLHPDDDIVEAKQKIANRGVFAGVINDIKLLNWPVEKIQEEVKRIISQGMDGGGFIFGTLMMPYNIPEDNIKAMLEQAYKTGEYIGEVV